MPYSLRGPKSVSGLESVAVDELEVGALQVSLSSVIAGNVSGVNTAGMIGEGFGTIVSKPGGHVYKTVSATPWTHPSNVDLCSVVVNKGVYLVSAFMICDVSANAANFEGTITINDVNDTGAVTLIRQYCPVGKTLVTLPAIVMTITQDASTIYFSGNSETTPSPTFTSIANELYVTRIA